MPTCAICQHLSLPPRVSAGTVGLITGAPTIVDVAVDHLGAAGEEEHVLVDACPEHVVDVYRGRVAGVRMAWRLSEDPATPWQQSPVAASASRA